MDEEIENKEPELVADSENTSETTTENTNEATDSFEPVKEPNIFETNTMTEKPQSFDMVAPVMNTETSFKSETADAMAPTEEKQSAPAPVVKKPVKNSMKNILIVLLVLILVAAAAGGAYYYRDNVANDLVKQKDATISSLQTQLAAEVARNLADSTADSTPTVTSVAPSAAVIENIKSAITSGNTAALEGYMAASVTTLTVPSDATISGTPTAAVTAVTSFIASATAPWNFSLSASVLSSYSNSSIKQYLPANAIIGKSANNKVISFSFDSNSKIKTVLMAVSESNLQ